MKKLLSSLLIGASFLSVGAQQVTKLSASKANDFGIVYSLPQTALQINLSAEGTVKTPGEFYQYAERYLGSQAAREAISKPSSTWVLTGATITPVGVPRTSDETWLMQFKSGATTFLLVNSQGLPLALGTEIEEPALPPAPEMSRKTLNVSDGTAARYAMSEDMIQSSSLAKRASLAAAQIMELRQSRQDYLTGQAEQMPDGAALKLILDNLNAQEEALTAMFLGTTVRRTEQTTLTVTPGANGESEMVIARLNPVKGFVEADDLSGLPVYLDVKVTDKGKMPVNEKGEMKKFPKGGIAYCIPGAAQAEITFKNRPFARLNFSFAQAGVIYGLDPSIFTDKKNPAYVIFDTTTGGVRELGTK
ncbi:MAG: DUF4831 family protein [Muribaculaceae bacterium]|nr:DUF4831 family protein [Muribaculaceae bacterium]